jgi:ATP-binding cassette subfamily G (WHITE) protein 2 (PDR)
MSSYSKSSPVDLLGGNDTVDGDLAHGYAPQHSVPQYSPVRAGDVEELTRIATHHSNLQSTKSNIRPAGSTVFSDPRFDPSNKAFDAYAWAQTVMRLGHEEGIKECRAGVIFTDMSVSGSGSALQTQTTIGSILTAPFQVRNFVNFGRSMPEKQILHNFHGSLQSGELLIVLGRPGSGCSTFLKTLCGQTNGITISEKTDIDYNGISYKTMQKEFGGEVVYNQEVDKHFPHLTVGETLEFAAAARAPQKRIMDISRAQYIERITQVVMAVYGLSHTYNTKVGDDFVRGVSGGERKRVR